MLAEQGADGSTREDAWRAGAMHYSSIIQTERDHWGKTPQGSGQHTHVCEYHTHLPKLGFEFCSRGLPQQIQNQDCGSTTISKLQVLSKLLKMRASNVSKNTCVKVLNNTDVVRGRLIPSPRLLLQALSRCRLKLFCQWGQKNNTIRTDTFIMQCIKKLSSPPINLECCERVLNGLTHLKDKVMAPGSRRLVN